MYTGGDLQGKMASRWSDDSVHPGEGLQEAAGGSARRIGGPVEQEQPAGAAGGTQTSCAYTV